jgi:DNA invertase Pin-like site-specific DNA recombinase
VTDRPLAEFRQDYDVQLVSIYILKYGSVTKAAIALSTTRTTIYRIIKRAKLPLRPADLLKELRRQQNLKFGN